MRPKCVYPYDYMDSFSKFNNTQLPNKEDFNSILSNENLTDEQYQHATNVWKTFDLKSVGEHQNLLTC